MRRACALLLTLLLMLSAAAAAEEVTHSVSYYYRNYCESCTPEEDFEQLFYALTGVRASDCQFEAHNVVSASGRAAFEAACAQYALDKNSLPLAVVDGVPYVGENQMNVELAQTALQWTSEKDSALLYLYVPACESCARVRTVLDQLSAEYEIKRGEAVLQSSVIISEMDASADPAAAEALFDAYAVPEDKRIAPCVFVGEYALCGADEIEDKLERILALGLGVGGIKDYVPKDISSNEPSLLASVAAGFVAGLNTCALSMLLMFMALLPELGARRARYALLYLASKLATYLLIGFVLLGLLQRINPTALLPIARLMMTIPGAVLIVMNLYDALQARRENYGKLRNQLPSGIRRRLHALLKRLTQTRVLVPSVLLLGVLVALGEFLCAGQIYLLRLLGAVRLEATRRGLELVLYCISFIAPSAIIVAVILRGCSAARVSEFLLKHTALVKLLTALVMLALIVLSWVM